ncbi:paraquat-inducible protein A [uncultured Tateyamaria sp.]|uniref:paraquat-inducible protein A n=1 Tax=uncultured Tateyamaria sp. TaxID=455651 RepID=UPI0026238C73|nr:paraquat-inducible protein A [uncultured Tateyamaria sp.]
MQLVSMARPESVAVLTAKSAGLVGCRRCARAWPGGTQHCGCCGAALRSRDPHSLQKVWAWWVAGLMCYVPANVYPMLRTHTLFTTEDATIVGGAIELFQHGAIGIALVILIASIAIPVGKFLAIAYLALTVARPRMLDGHHRQMLYEVIEYIGRWSMIDVFVVAILASLVQLGNAASITAGVASLTFALSVIFTMLSAQAFDSRLIWDQSVSHKDPVDVE